MSEFRVGDVLRYTPLPQYQGQRDVRWCREGTAIVKASGNALDTFWGSGGDQHVVTDAELAGAEVIFNLGDYDEIPHASRYRWKLYAETDRAELPSQHGLEVRWFVRKGAAEDLPTQVDNARQELAQAVADAEVARLRVEWRKRELAEIEARALSEVGRG